MPREKTWSANNVSLGKLTIIDGPVAGELIIERRYDYLDNAGNKLAIAGNRVIYTSQFSDLPRSIRDAITALNDWTKQIALTQEDMHDLV